MTRRHPSKYSFSKVEFLLFRVEKRTESLIYCLLDFHHFESFRLPDEHEDPEAYAEKLFGSQNNRGINFASYDDIPVEISEGSADPIKSLSEAEFDAQIVPNLERMGFEDLTPIQQYSIPVLLDYQDLMACAQTGSGKTAAFLLPIISRVIEEKEKSDQINMDYEMMAKPRGVIVSPTRELALQIFTEAKKITFGTNIRPCVVYGGAPANQQIRYLHIHKN